MRIKLLLAIVLIPFVLTAQTVWENSRSEVYPYLYRLAQKGLIDFQDIIQPVSRQQIATLLQELEQQSEQLDRKSVV